MIFTEQELHKKLAQRYKSRKKRTRYLCKEEKENLKFEYKKGKYEGEFWRWSDGKIFIFIYDCETDTMLSYRYR